MTRGIPPICNLQKALLFEGKLRLLKQPLFSEAKIYLT